VTHASRLPWRSTRRSASRSRSPSSHGSREENDLVGEQFTHWFLQEQREEVASMSDLLKIVERSSESNILLAEDYLARNPVGDQGEAANAPPAAGGAL